MSNSQEILARALALKPQIIERRRQIHAEPELSFHETKTAALAGDWLEKLGFTVQSAVANTGLVADFGTGKTIAIRSDMDALPGFEANRTNYVSRTPGVMHACGHDAHIALVIAAAQLIKEQNPKGRLRIILQPGTEEAERDGNQGAKMLVEAGALLDVSALIGLHVDATIETGSVGIISTPLNSLMGGFTLSVSAESSANNKAADALPAANNIMSAIYKLSQEQVNAAEPVTISLGSCLSSSQRGNIASQQVSLAGTISSTTTAGQERAAEMLRKLLAKENLDGITVSMEVSELNSTSSESASVVDVLRQAATDLLGEAKVMSINRKTWASDFALLANSAPAAFMYLGAQIKGSRRIHHHAAFDIDECGLHLGAAILALTALRLFKN